MILDILYWKKGMPGNQAVATRGKKIVNTKRCTHAVDQKKKTC